MLQITPQMKILVAVEPADFRRGIDGLARLGRQALRYDPFAGTVFVFRNKRGHRFKPLYRDEEGYALLSGRLEGGTSHFPAATGQGLQIPPPGRQPPGLSRLISGCFFPAREGILPQHSFAHPPSPGKASHVESF